MKYKSLAVASVALFGLFSCNVTDLTPSDSITDPTFWKTTTDLELYANGFYGLLGGADAWSDVGTDVRLDVNINTFFQGTYVVPDANSNWNFGNIRNANYFLQRYQTVKGEQSTINHYVGEVRFFRALEYWSKVCRFGDYPWYDEDLKASDEEQIFSGRTPRAEVVGHIIEDLQYACENLKVPAEIDRCRLNKYVAYTQLARVCLYEGTRAKYANDKTFDAEALLKKAEVAAKFVMDNGGYDIVKDAKNDGGQLDAQHPMNYHALFTQLGSISANKECILAREYQQNVLTHGVTRTLDDGSNSGMTKAMINQYLCIDGQPIAVSPLYLGDDTLELELKNRDPRLYQTIDNSSMPENITAGKTQFTGQPVIAGSSPTGYNFRKHYHPDPTQMIAEASWVQWFLYRYAEVLLVYAEARAELGTITQADIDMTINKLRDRVGVTPLNMGSIVTDPNWRDYGYALSPVLHEIRRERSVELIAEGFRYGDIMRWRAGKLLEDPLAVYGCTVTDFVITKYPKAFDLGDGNGMKLVTYKGSRYIRAYTNLEGGYKWNDKMYLTPVPKGQLSLNPKLKPQNPGWPE